jgi:hypothetical protein
VAQVTELVQHGTVLDKHQQERQQQCERRSAHGHKTSRPRGPVRSLACDPCCFPEHAGRADPLLGRSEGIFGRVCEPIDGPGAPGTLIKRSCGCMCSPSWRFSYCLHSGRRAAVLPRAGGARRSARHHPLVRARQRGRAPLRHRTEFHLPRPGERRAPSVRARRARQQAGGVDDAVLHQPGARILRILLEPCAAAAETEAVPPGVHVREQAFAADVRQLVRE